MGYNNVSVITQNSKLQTNIFHLHQIDIYNISFTIDGKTLPLKKLLTEQIYTLIYISEVFKKHYTNYER